MTTNNNQLAQVSVLRHSDVNGKELLYLRIVANGVTKNINIGKQTFDEIEKMMTPPAAVTTVNVLKPEGGAK